MSRFIGGSLVASGSTGSLRFRLRIFLRIYSFICFNGFCLLRHLISGNIWLRFFLMRFEFLENSAAPVIKGCRCHQQDSVRAAAEFLREKLLQGSYRKRRVTALPPQHGFADFIFWKAWLFSATFFWERQEWMGSWAVLFRTFTCLRQRAL